MGEVLNKKDAETIKGWLPQHEEKEKVTYIKEETSKEDLEKIKKLEAEIKKDIKKVLSNLDKLYELKPTKETYDDLITISMAQRN